MEGDLVVSKFAEWRKLVVLTFVEGLALLLAGEISPRLLGHKEM